MTATIPILMYHEVGPLETLTERYTVPDRMFRMQLQYLRDQGFRTLNLDQYLAESHATADQSHPGKAVVITFDDNNICHYRTTAPILREFDFQATFFVVSSFLDTRSDMLTSAQLVQMNKAGMRVESHSHTHRFLSDLSRIELREELATSRTILEDRLQTEIRFVSCPGGRYHRRVLDEALDLGYHGVCTSAPGLSLLGHGSPSQMLNRFLISATTSLETFAKIVRADKHYVQRAILGNRAKEAVKALLGSRRYDSLWQRFRRHV